AFVSGRLGAAWAWGAGLRTARIRWVRSRCRSWMGANEKVLASVSTRRGPSDGAGPGAGPTVLLVRPQEVSPTVGRRCGEERSGVGARGGRGGRRGLGGRPALSGDAGGVGGGADGLVVAAQVVHGGEEVTDPVVGHECARPFRNGGDGSCTFRGRV